MAYGQNTSSCDPLSEYTDLSFQTLNDLRSTFLFTFNWFCNVGKLTFRVFLVHELLILTKYFVWNIYICFLYLQIVWIQCAYQKSCTLNQVQYNTQLMSLG